MSPRIRSSQVVRDPDRRGGWLFREGIPITGPLDYVFQVAVPVSDSPLELHLVFADDGVYVPAIVRKPAGPGPFPAVLTVHRSCGGVGISFLVDQVLNEGFVFDRFLEEGYVICHTEGRQEIEEAYGTDIPAVLDHMDVVNTYRYLSRLPYVDPQRIGFFGISHGGEVQMKLISEIQEGPAALVPGEPSVIEYLGLRYEGERNEAGLQFNADLDDSQIDFDRAWERIQRISPTVPILVLGREKDHLQGLFRKLYDLLKRAGKNAHWISREYPTHGYQWGPRRTNGGYHPDAQQQETLGDIVAFLNEHVKG